MPGPDDVALLDPGAGLEERLLTIRGRRVRTVRGGEGAVTVVFESGMSASAAEWVTVQRQVAAHTATLASDRPGYGGSEPGPDERSLSRLAQELDETLEAAGVTGPIVLVGHSWGGPILRTFLQSTARDVRGVLLVDGTLSAVMGRVEAFATWASFAFRARRARSRSRRGASGFGSDDPATRGMPDADRAILQRDLLNPADIATSAREAKGMRAVVTRLPALEAAGFPPGIEVAFLMGALPDRGMPGIRPRFVAAGRAEAERLGARFTIAEDSSHFVPQQQPELVAVEILRLVRGVGTASSGPPAHPARGRARRPFRRRTGPRS
jgi:pimeloyl-ACP methyl ester carboxylesterase